MKHMLASLLLLIAPAVAQAALSTHEEVVQRGAFEDKDCDPTESEFADLCLCESDISKLVVSGLPAAINDKVNALLAKEVGVPTAKQQDGTDGFCYGETARPKKDAHGTDITRNTKLIYEQGDVATFLTEYYFYGAGAAHGMYGSSPLMVNLKTGAAIDFFKIATQKQIEQADAYVRKEVKTTHRDAVFDEELKRTKPYLTQAGCDGCDIYADAKGWVVHFGIYAISCYACGEVDIRVPASILPSPQAMISEL